MVLLYYTSILLYTIGWVFLRIPIIRYICKPVPILYILYYINKQYSVDNSINKLKVFLFYLLGDIAFMFDDIYLFCFPLAIIFFSISHIYYYQLIMSDEDRKKEIFLNIMVFILPFLHFLLYIHNPSILIPCAYYGELLFIIWIQLYSESNEFFAFSLFIISDILLVINMFLSNHSIIIEFLSIHLYWLSVSCHFLILIN